MKKVFLISGKLRSGKNQFATYLDQQFVLDHKTVRQDFFAKILKDWCKDDMSLLTGYINTTVSQTINVLNTHKKYLIERYPAHEKTTATPLNGAIDLLLPLITMSEHFYENKNDISRILLQLYGTEIFRKRIDNDFWVKKLIEKIKTYKEDVVIITDVRFPNEMELTLDDEDLDVTSIRIERNMNRVSDINEHESETALDNFSNFDFIVDNNGSLEDLWNSMETIYTTIKEERELLV